MTLDEAKNLKSGDLIECLYQGRVWIRALFEKLEGDKILKGNGDLAGLDECRLIPIEEKHLESYGFKRDVHNWQFWDYKNYSEDGHVSIKHSYGITFVCGQHKINLTHVHELMRYCKENNIEGKGWI